MATLLTSFAQPVGLHVEVDCSSPCNAGLMEDGYTTYTVWLDCMNDGDGLNIMYNGDDLINPMYLDATGPMFQHDFGAVIWHDINAAFYPFFPELLCDSYFTLGQDPDAVIFSIGQNTETAWEEDGDFFMQDMAFYSKGIADTAGSDLKILVAQLTTTGPFQFCANFNVIEEGGLEQYSEYYCVNSADYTFQNISVLATENALCNGELGTGTFSFPDGATYNLFMNGELIADSLAVSELTNLQPGTYMVELNLDLECGGTTTFEIQQDELTLVDQSQSPACFDSDDGFLGYETANGETIVTEIFLDAGMNEILPTDLGGGTYYIQATDEYGCYAELQVELAEPDALETSVTSSDVNCYGYEAGTVVIVMSGGTTPYSMSINGPESQTNATGEFYNLPAGEYAWTAQDANGCDGGSGTIAINEPTELLVEVDIDGNEYFAGVSGGTEPYQYIWTWTSAGGNEVAYTPSATINCVGSNIELEVIDENNCVYSEAFLCVGLSELNSADILNYPNPASEFLTLHGLRDVEYKTDLIDAAGRIVFTRKFIPSSGSFNLDIASACPGVYSLLLETQSATVLLKVVKL